MLYSSIEETIGNTPLVRLKRIEEKYELKSRLFAKLEYFNPGGSIKDRTALSMIDSAYENGYIKEGWTLVEPTSGNTGIGLATVACKYKLKVILTMPESVSKERIGLIKALGATPVLTPKEYGIKGAIEKAEEILKNTPDSFMTMQFANKANPEAHYNNTAVEIFNDLGRAPDVFIAGVGTGGTITGCGQFYSNGNYNTEIIAVEPFESSVISGETPGKHGIQGIGAGFIPDILDVSVIDRIMRISTEEAREYSKVLNSVEKVTGGISAGAALCAAIKVAIEMKDKDIVFIVPDTSERYLSTGMFDE
ncbi:MAG: cysteine synthase A [Clostridia bacterium]|nr:cysteine synthase A [Clostridia bacterium]MBN2884197.1 cysteine synthase A [Clostridia bacterium]